MSLVSNVAFGVPHTLVGDFTITGSLSITGDFSLDSVAAQNIFLGDDDTLEFGNTAAAPNVSILWETADANANELIFVGPAGGATDVPVFVFGDVTLLNKDLGLFNGVTAPTIAVVNDAATKALYFQHDGTDGIIKTTSGSVGFEDDSYMDTTGVATAGVTTYPSFDFFINGSGWDTDDLVARTTGARFRWTGSSSGTPGGTLTLVSMSDAVAGNTMLSINSGGTGTFNGNVYSTNGLFSTTASISITLKGNDADDATGVGVILDNGVTLTNAASKLVSIKNNTTEKAYFDYLGNFYAPANKALIIGVEDQPDTGNTAGVGLSILADDGGGLAAGVANGGSIAITAGDAGGSTGNGNGGIITLTGGAKVNSGTPGYVRIGNGAPTNLLSVFDTESLYVDGYMEVNNGSSFNGTVNIYSAIVTRDSIQFLLGNTSTTDNVIKHDTVQTPDTLMIGLSNGVTGAGSRAMVIVDKASAPNPTTFDFGDHGAATYGDGAGLRLSNPTLIIHSVNESQTQYLALAHDATDATIRTGLGGVSILPAVQTSGAPSAFKVTGAAHTGITAATEAIGINFNLSATKTWATGAGPLAAQREVVFQAPTYAGGVAALTMTKAATVAITNAPQVGANMVISNAYALWVQAGTAQFDGGIVTTSSTLTSLVVAPTATGNVIDCQLETEWTTGTVLNADFGGATTLTGSITGVSLDFNTNLTSLANADVYGVTLKTPALTQATADAVEYFGFNIPTAGALVQNTLAGTIDWRGVNIQLPNTTQTTGVVNSCGVYIAGGTVTSGTQLGLYTTGVTNRFILGASNQFSIDASTTTHANSTNVFATQGAWGNDNVGNVGVLTASATSGGMTTTGNSVIGHSSALTTSALDAASTFMIGYMAVIGTDNGGSQTLIAYAANAGYDATVVALGDSIDIYPITTAAGNGYNVNIHASEAQGPGPSNGGIMTIYGGAKAGVGNDGYVKVGQGAGTPATTFTDDDLYVVGNIEFAGAAITGYKAVNDANPNLNLGATAAESLKITATYAAGTQTLQTVNFVTATASATADYGAYSFNVDGSVIATIDDGGMEVTGTVNATGGFTDGTMTIDGSGAITGVTSLAMGGALSGVTTLALSQGITQTTTVTGTMYDMILETEWTTGTLINADFAGATTQSGDMYGLVFNFNDNLAGVTDLDVTGAVIKTPALTQSAANTTNYIGYNLPTAGALVQNTAAGTINWKGVNIQMPNTTQTTGTVNAYGISVTGGTVTSGTEAGIYINMAAGGDTAINVALGNTYLNGSVGIIQNAAPSVALTSGWSGAMVPATTAARHGLFTGNITELADATITDIVGVYINNFTVTDGGGTETVGILAGLYIPGAPIAGTTPTNGPYSIFVDAGTSRFDGKCIFTNESIQIKRAVTDIAGAVPTDAELDTAFGDPTVVGSGFVGILDDADGGTATFICWTTGTAGEWFYAAGTKAL